LALPPNETGLEKICLFPEKLASLRQGGLDPLYPVSVELSLTSRCDLKCVWCSELALRDRCPDDLSMAVLKELFQDLAAGGARGVTIEGGGEPTLAPFFPEATLAAKAAGLEVGLITNGLRLFRPDAPLSFYRIFQWIRVSLDATDRGEYLRLKGHDGFDRTMGNLARLAALASQGPEPDLASLTAGPPDDSPLSDPFDSAQSSPAAAAAQTGPTVGVGYVLTNQNDDPQKLWALAERLRGLKVAYLQLRPVVDHPELSSARSVEFLKELQTPAFAVNTAAMTDNQGAGNDGLPCRAHSLATVVTADGAMWLCGRLCQDPQAGPLGYLTKSGFKAIWEGQTRAAQAAQAALGDFCRGHCPPCRLTKYNRLLSRLELIRTRDFI
jgi:hypothetical protein